MRGSLAKRVRHTGAGAILPSFQILTPFLNSSLPKSYGSLKTEWVSICKPFKTPSTWWGYIRSFLLLFFIPCYIFSHCLFKIIMWLYISIAEKLERGKLNFLSKILPTWPVCDLFCANIYAESKCKSLISQLPYPLSPR